MGSDKDKDNRVTIFNAAWLLIGNVAYAVFLWAILASIARFGTPSMVGTYSYSLALVSPVIMFFNLRLRFVQISDSKNEAKFDDYLTIRQLSTVSALFVVLMLILWMDLSKEAFYVVVIIAIAKGFEAISDVYYGLLIKYERMQHVALSLIIKGSLSFIVFGSLLYIYGSLVAACLGMAVVWGLVFSLFDRRNSAKLLEVVTNNYKDTVQRLTLINNYHRNNWAVLYGIVRKAFPLGVMGFLATLSVNIPRYVIEWNMGVRELGYYAAVTYIMLGGVMIMSALGQSTIPRLSRYVADENMREFKWLLMKILSVAFTVGILGWLFVIFFGRELLLLLYGGLYAEYTSHLRVIMFAALLNYMAICFWYALTALHSYWSQCYLFLLDVCLITVTSIALVPSYGIMGAIYAVVIVMLFHFIAGGLVVYYKIAEELVT